MLALADVFFPHTVVFLFLAVPIAALWLAARGTLSAYRSSRTLPSTTLERLGAATTKSFSDGPGADLPRAREWWADASLFQLERRAIFSKTWICVGHRGRFLKPGDYLSHELAGFRIFLILGKDGVVRAFHNVCRHRAFPVTHKASGSTTVLACQYHGWTYNTLGQLTTAPHFDQLPGFPRSDNGLFAIHTKTDGRGFVHVNLSGSPEAGDSEVADAEASGRCLRPAPIDKNARLVYSWQGKGQFSWKIVSSETDRAAFARLSPSSVFAQALAACGLGSSSTGQLQFFPLATAHTNAGSPFWYQLIYSPDSPGQTTVQCDVYTTQTTDGSWGFGDDVKDRLQSQLQFLIQTYESTHAKLSSPTPGSPREDRDNYNSHRLASLVKAHRQSEYTEGREIHPAAVRQCRSAAFAQAESICNAMTCASTELEW